MGAKGRGKGGAARTARGGGASAPPAAATTTAGQAPTIPSPACVTKLFSDDLGVVEEGCSDIAVFALQPVHHASLLACGVPSRLAHILFHATVHPGAVATDIGYAVFARIAAAEALRNMIVNSGSDALLDALVGSTMSGESNLAVATASAIQTFSPAFATKRQSSSLDVLLREPKTSAEDSASHVATHTDLEELPEPSSSPPSAHQPPPSSPSSSYYLATGRYLEELLQLAAVCVEGSERAAEIFSTSEVLGDMMHLLQLCSQAALENVQHPVDYFNAKHMPPRGAEAPATGSPEHKRLQLVVFKRRETVVMSSMAVAVAEVLQVLSSENEAMSALLAADGGRHGAATLPPEVFDLLNQLVAAPVVHAWWAALTAPSGGSSQHTPGQVVSEKDVVLLKLTRLTLHVDGMLVGCVGSADNCQRVLPLVVSVLSRVHPVQEWRRTLPFIMDGCQAEEEDRALLVEVAIHRLRCGQVALSVLNPVVDWVCSFQRADDDDETSFALNPHATMLRSTGALAALGELLRDVLFLGNGESGAAQDVMTQRSVRGAAAANPEVTTLQFLFLSNEVGILGLAQTLLLMVPIETLGDVASVWRAMVGGLRTRYQMLMEAAQAEATQAVAGASPYHADGPSGATVVTYSESARALVWLQMESLMQMLWAMQRKQHQRHGAGNTLIGAVAADVDVLTRLAWESRSSATLKQAAIGATALLCLSFNDAEAVAVGARFCLAMMAGAEGVVPAAAVATGGPAVVWDEAGLAQAVASASVATVVAFVRAMDEHAAARSEAANSLIDLFSDEGYDRDVYVPLGVHDALQAFLPLVQSYLRKRKHGVRQLSCHSAEAAALLTDGDGVGEMLCHVEEIAENLSAFLQYKLKTLPDRVGA